MTWSAAAERRYSDRRPFRVEPVPERAVDRLVAAAADGDVYAAVVQREDERLDLAVVFSWADQVEAGDADYRAELARWTRRAGEGAPDGVPASAVPHAVPGSPRHTDVPVRDFEAGITGGESLPEGVDEQPLYLVVFTIDDTPEARLRAGEAYMRLSVEAERLGLASSAMTQAVDLPPVRERFRRVDGLAGPPADGAAGRLAAGRAAARADRPAPGVRGADLRLASTVDADRPRSHPAAAPHRADDADDADDDGDDGDDDADGRPG